MRVRKREAEGVYVCATVSVCVSGGVNGWVGVCVSIRGGKREIESVRKRECERERKVTRSMYESQAKKTLRTILTGTYDIIFVLTFISKPDRSPVVIAATVVRTISLSSEKNMYS